MDNKPYSLLVVDTNAEALFSMVQPLSDHGFRVHTAINVEQAISIGIRENIDLLVTRFRLDACTGNVLTKRLRTIKRLRQMGVLYLCASQTAGVVLRTAGKMPEYSIRCPARMPVLIELASLTLNSRPSPRFESLEPTVVPAVPPPHAPFVPSIHVQVNSNEVS